MLRAIGFTYNNDTMAPGLYIENIKSWSNIAEETIITDLGSTDTTVQTLKANNINVIETEQDEVIHNKDAVKIGFDKILEKYTDGWMIQLYPNYHEVPYFKQQYLEHKLNNLSQDNKYSLSTIEKFNGDHYIMENRIGFVAPEPLIFYRPIVGSVGFQNEILDEDGGEIARNSELYSNVLQNVIKDEIDEIIDEYYSIPEQVSDYYSKVINDTLKNTEILLLHCRAHENLNYSSRIKRMWHVPHYVYVYSDKKIEAINIDDQVVLNDTIKLKVKYQRYAI